MGLLEEELKEIRRDIKHFRAGEIDAETFDTLMRGYKRSERRSLLYMKATAMTGPERNRLITAGLMGDGILIDLSQEEINEEKILCSIKDRYITRSECLDYSGETEHFKDCNSCDTGLANKRLLCPPQTRV